MGQLSALLASAPRDRERIEQTLTDGYAHALSLEGPPVSVVEALFPSEALRPASADLVLGESSASAGDAVFARELLEARALLAPGGEALVLATEKQTREWLPRTAGAGASVLLRREGFAAA